MAKTLDKSKRISEVKQLFESGLIFFDKSKSLNLERYIICYDKGIKKDYSVMRTFL